MLTQAQAGELKHQVLPVEWHEQPYTIPSVPEGSDFDFRAVRLDGPQLADELTKWKSSLLWPSFEAVFNQIHSEHRRPLRDMTKWHLALALAGSSPGTAGCF